MTKIWKETGFVTDDPWVIETEEAKAGSNERPIVGLKEFLDRSVETGNDGPLAVLINPADDVMALKPHIDQLELIAVAFPAFSDGRAFSHASLLRSRLGFKGEIRAVGDVLIDHIPLMLRCGIDSFSVTNATAIKRLSEGRLPGIDNHYQPTARPSADAKSYSWRRVS
ncbi:DUF934 domain-containing protein [Pararhizobium sp.]|uniref:DUF934 domain-containing protein n=1 Tax=Pararhizobium sp. TaxID=1977563 RepID=UPI0027281757|nr:DUF934 domain-containing protein [Pararhizobium sp.]MDO9418606.1 DUF934 domain-containing protein [Pararhizobium sp.]